MSVGMGNDKEVQDSGDKSCVIPERVRWLIAFTDDGP